MDPHELYMQQCLDLARLGQGKTHPNPMVGCVVLDASGQKIGEGYHPHHGGPHAEVVALEQAGEQAWGGTLYASLEPCNHFGKTPPCTDKIIAAGIKTVYCAMVDPNAKVSGKGIKRLQAEGITVHTGTLEKEATKLNEAFCHFIQAHQPFVILKQALTLDGKVATRNGQSQWITSPLARQWVHQLRAESGGILTTAETVIKDNALLTVRDVPLSGTPPRRIILDRNARLAPENYTIFQKSPLGGPVWLFTKAGNRQHPHMQAALKMGAQVHEVSDNGQGLVLPEILEILGKEKITQLLVEAGGRLAGSLIQHNQVQKLWLMYGNKLLLDPAATAGFSGNPLFNLDQAIEVEFSHCFKLENTWVVEAYPLFSK